MATTGEAIVDHFRTYIMFCFVFSRKNNVALLCFRLKCVLHVMRTLTTTNAAMVYLHLHWCILYRFWDRFVVVMGSVWDRLGIVLESCLGSF